MTDRRDRYGMVIPDVDMSPAAVELRKAKVIASARRADAWGLRWWKRRRAYIEEHDPFTPWNPPEPPERQSEEDWTHR